MRGNNCKFGLVWIIASQIVLGRGGPGLYGPVYVWNEIVSEFYLSESDPHNVVMCQGQDCFIRLGLQTCCERRANSMPPHPQLSLPIEVEERIIDFVGAFYGVSIEWDRTLRSCALTCRSWLLRCRIHLFRSLRVPNTRSLNRLLVSVSSSSATSTFCHTDNVIGDPLLEDNNPDQQTFFHLIPHYLAKKLPHVSLLEFTRHPQHIRTHSFHPTFFMYMKHFRSIKSLWLYNHRFVSFPDVRRLLSSLPSLENVHLHNIHWDTDTLIPVSIPRSTKHYLSYLELDDVQSVSCGMQFWILAGQKPSQVLTMSGTINSTESHPGLSKEDVVAMSRVIECLDLPHDWNAQGSLRWTLVSQMGRCRSFDWSFVHDH